MQKHISPAEAARSRAVPVRVVLVTMDTNTASALGRARIELMRDLPGLTLDVHAAAEFASDSRALERCKADIAAGDIVISTMLFLEDHFQPVVESLRARRDTCDAMVCAMSAGDVTRLTRIGRFDMSKPQTGALAFLKKLRGTKGKEKTAGASQMRMLRQLPKFLKFIPGTAQDVRAYFLVLQYWLGGSDRNMANMIRMLVDKYADGPRRVLRGKLKVADPIEYPEVGVYHPRMQGRLSTSIGALPAGPQGKKIGTVGVLMLRSYILAGNTGHYDGVIAAFEARGLRVVPAFAAGLDARPAIEKFFMADGVATIDAMVSLTGFSLVGGPAYNDAKAAEEILATLDVPYVGAMPVEFQTLEQWGSSDRGMLPMEATMMVAIPELDGATGSSVFGGRVSGNGAQCKGCHRACTFTALEADKDMHVCPDRAEMLAARVARLVTLRRSERAARKVALVLFNYPPNAGNTGTAAYLSVFSSLHNTLVGLEAAGYSVDVPATADQLRDEIIHGNAERYGSLANVATRVPAGDHVRRERWLPEIEAQWGPAPGKQQTDGSSIHVLGRHYGNVFIGVQPAFGYEGDPMRLLFEKGFTPTHAFSAFYRYIREDFGAHAVLHFGTHGALEFMPGKQTGLSGSSWPDRLIGDLPNFYLYAANNPSEGMIAKRRSAATLISYLTPPVGQAGLYRGLVDLKSSIDRWRQALPETAAARTQLAELIQTQASQLDMVAAAPLWSEDDFEARIGKLGCDVLELEYSLIPHGLHVVGGAMSTEARADMLLSIADAGHSLRPDRRAMQALAAGATAEEALALADLPRGDAMLAVFRELHKTHEQIEQEHEIPAIVAALDGRFIRPVAGGDVLRNPGIVPTGRNLHGFDPFRIPSAYAVKDGAQQAARLLQRHLDDGNDFPETIAIVLWGTDNLKTEGGPLAQAMALIGVTPRFDSYGRLAGAELIPLDTLLRPRVDVVLSLSGIFRDLLPLQIKLLAEACFLAASADEPPHMNFVRKHALAYQAEHGCDLETASLRVFGNADGAYGSNVNNLVENGRWQDEDELAETYTRRKGFAYGRAGVPMQQPELLKSVLGSVDLAYQNLDSVELGVTTIDTYFDTLGGMSRAVRRAKGGKAAPVYIGDQTKGAGSVRTLGEQVALETRTRMLNPKWYEGMLKHGYEGVRQIEVHVTNTMGWSATTGDVAPWVYQQLTQTFVLDADMRERLATLNPTASLKMAQRLIEAHERQYWTPDEATLKALREAGEELEDRLEGVGVEAAA